MYASKIYKFLKKNMQKIFNNWRATINNGYALERDRNSFCLKMAAFPMRLNGVFLSQKIDKLLSNVYTDVFLLKFWSGNLKI